MINKRVFALFVDEYNEHLQGLLLGKTITRYYQIELFTNIEDLSQLVRTHFSALIIYVNIKRIRDSLFNKVDEFISSGGGLLSLHSTTASFSNQPKFTEIVGAKFVRHGPITEYLVQPSESQNIVYSGISEFIVEDELYRQKYTKNAIEQFIYHGKRLVEPLIWINNYGKGRIVGISPGHKTETLNNPKMVIIMRRSLEWLMRKDKAQK